MKAEKKVEKKAEFVRQNNSFETSEKGHSIEDIAECVDLMRKL